MDRATLDRELANAWHELTRPGGRFAMTSIQRNGTAMRAYADPPRSLAAVWDALGAYAERDYLVFGETRITYANAQVLVARLGGWLALRDVRRGDRVGIAMRNYPEWLIAYWACVARGIVAVGFNAWWTADEMAAALRLTEPKVMICDEERMTRLSDKTAGLIRVLVRAPATGDVLAWDDVIATNSVPLDAEVDLDDDACIFFTSGTTGAAKAARLTHRNCSTNIMNMQFAAEVQATALGRTLGGTVDLGAAPAPVGLATTPLFHVTALNCLAHPITAAGGTLSRYGSSTHKQVYIYGGLDTNPTEIDRGYGMAWGLGGFLLTPFLAKAGPNKVQALRGRVARDLTTTFASHYSQTISLSEALKPDTARHYARKATGEKFLIDPSR